MVVELGGGIHGSSALERPESKGERSEAKGEAEGVSEGVEELGHPLLGVQGAGQLMAMEVGAPSHAWRPHDISSNARQASVWPVWDKVWAGYGLIWSLGLRQSLITSKYTLTLIKGALPLEPRIRR